VLLHLPDQALHQMQKKGLINEGEDLAATQLTIDTLEDGSVVYKAPSKQTRVVLGLFRRDFDTTVTLDDSTSAVETEQPENASLGDRLLWMLSR
jgi:hypothetical protein